MDAVDQIFRTLGRRPERSVPVIGCLYTGSTLPSSCAPMPRCPVPATGMLLDVSFPCTLEKAVAENPAVHDGAVMVGRRDRSDPYRVAGWSFRLFPAPAGGETEDNRGSAFNSCLAMSLVPDVDRLYLVSGAGVLRFELGHATEL